MPSGWLPIRGWVERSSVHHIPVTLDFQLLGRKLPFFGHMAADGILRRICPSAFLVFKQPRPTSGAVETSPGGMGEGKREGMKNVLKIKNPKELFSSLILLILADFLVCVCLSVLLLSSCRSKGTIYIWAPLPASLSFCTLFVCMLFSYPYSSCVSHHQSTMPSALVMPSFCLLWFSQLTIGLLVRRLWALCCFTERLCTRNNEICPGL